LFVLSGHTLAVTSLALTDDDSSIFSASKDASIIQWDSETGKRVLTFAPKRKSGRGHEGPVLCVAVSSDGKFLASGGADRFVHLWDLTSGTLVESFGAHRDTVSALAFRHGTYQLQSGSFDRTVKIWDVEARAYVDTLFGHEDEVFALDAMTKERAVSCSRDKSARLWKIPEESQLLFAGAHTASVDCVRMLTEDLFVTGSADGSIAVWHASRKKPQVVVSQAHTILPQQQQKDAAVASPPPWIISLASVRNSDLFASGSNTGQVKFWKYTHASKSVETVATVPMVGFVNALSFSRTCRFLVAGIGRDHRLGRWSSQTQARNGICIVPLLSGSEGV